MSGQLSEELRTLIRPIARLQLLMWSTIFVPKIIYGVILYVMNTQGVKIEANLPPVTLYVLGAVAGLSVVVGIAVHVFFSSERRIAACVSSVPNDEELAKDPRTHRASPERLALVRHLSRLEKGLLNYARKSFTFFMLSTPTVHTCAVVGLLVAILVGRPLVYLPFALLAAVPTLFMRPRLFERMEDYARMQPPRPDDQGDGLRD